ncbi:hypothetical protein [Streptomyces regalis]|uniref:Uncharacterized protein n=1 Tax=Streptomyces regalis TaxID=68262 RepID=A0A101JBG2_9ACTN|nr:hypothetical protein [Streptomyces regalis]KUL23730.1 hypothetical protein ADL12_38820 [Streptomyces regalis]
MTGAFDATPQTCTRLPPRPPLTSVIEGTCYTAVPAPAHTPASALYLACCMGCGAAYTRPWRRLANASHAAA